MSVYPDKYQGIIAHYLEELDKADQKRKPGSGIFGIGQGPGDYPCHEEMDSQVAELVGEVLANETGPEETAAVVRTILEAEQSRKWAEPARWAVLATQRHTLPLISQMNAADREEIAAWYEQTYPRRRRVPIQRQILEKLKEY